MGMKNNHIIFVTTRDNRNSIAVLAGVLEADPVLAGVPVHFLAAGSHLPEQVNRLAETTDRVVAAFSFATLSLPEVARQVRRLRALARPNLSLVAGGPHPSGDPEGTLRLGFDAVVMGEGEQTFPAWLRRVFAGQDWRDLPGLAHSLDGHPVRTDRPPWVNLDEHPPFSLRHRRWAPIEISRGCPWACTFCQTPYFLGGRMRHRRLETVMYWIEAARPLGYRYVRFITPNAFAYGSADGRTPNLEAIESLLQTISQLVGRERVYFGSFPSEVRPESVTPETVALVKKYCGNRHLVLGAQTGSPRLLSTLHRGHTVDDVYRAVEVTVRAGLTPCLEFIFGLPGETPEDRRLTLQAIQDLTRMGGIIRSGVFIPLPGTPLASAPPGRIDPELHRFLGQMAERGQQSGRWPTWVRRLAEVTAT